MGVKIKELITKTTISFDLLKGKIIAIDAPNIIFQFFGFVLDRENSSNLFIDRTQKPINHLYGLLYRVNFLYSKKILPIFCFDGKVNEFKRLITKNELHDYLTVKKWYKTALTQGNKKKARNIALSRDFFWYNIIEESKLLLSKMGIPYIEAPSCAEAQCAFLVKNRIADYANTADYDALLFGSPYIVQNLSKSQKRKINGRWIYNKITPMQIDLKFNLKKLKINIFQLIDIAILVGNDYFKGISHIGAKTAYNLIKKYGNLESLIFKENNNYNFSELSEHKILELRKIFLFPEIKKISEPLLWNIPDDINLFNFLCLEHSLNKERIKNIINRLINNYKECINYFKRTISNHSKLIQTTLF